MNELFQTAATAEFCTLQRHKLWGSVGYLPKKAQPSLPHNIFEWSRAAPLAGIAVTTQCDIVNEALSPISVLTHSCSVYIILQMINALLLKKYNLCSYLQGNFG